MLVSSLARGAKPACVSWRDRASGSVALRCLFESLLAVAGQPVVAPWWALLGLSDTLGFPFRGHHAFSFEPAKDGIDSSAGEVRRVHDVEPVVITTRQRFEHQCRGESDLHG